MPGPRRQACVRGSLGTRGERARRWAAAEASQAPPQGPVDGEQRCGHAVMGREMMCAQTAQVTETAPWESPGDPVALKALALWSQNCQRTSLTTETKPQSSLASSKVPPAALAGLLSG